jgi:hypothetical protein
LSDVFVVHQTLLIECTWSDEASRWPKTPVL